VQNTFLYNLFILFKAFKTMVRRWCR